MSRTMLTQMFEASIPLQGALATPRLLAASLIELAEDIERQGLEFRGFLVDEQKNGNCSLAVTARKRVETEGAQ